MNVSPALGTKIIVVIKPYAVQNGRHVMAILVQIKDIIGRAEKTTFHSET